MESDDEVGRRQERVRCGRAVRARSPRIVAIPVFDTAPTRQGKQTATSTSTSSTSSDFSSTRWTGQRHHRIFNNGPGLIEVSGAGTLNSNPSFAKVVMLVR